MKKLLILFVYILISFLFINGISFAETLNITATNDITATNNTTTIITPTLNVSTPTENTLSNLEITKIELIKYINGFPQMRSVSTNEELKVSQNTRIRFTLNKDFNKSTVPFVYLNNGLISNDKSIFETASANAFEVVLNPLLIKQKYNKIRIERITNFNELIFIFDSLPPSLNVSNPVLDDYTVNKPDILIEGLTETESKVNISGMPIDIDTFGNFRKSITLKPGKNTLLIESEDLCGNKTAMTKIIKYEPSYPVLEFVFPTQNSWIKPNDPFLFEVTVKDEQNDIAPNAQPYIIVNNNKKVENAELINYDLSTNKITGIYTPENTGSSSLLEFSICIPDKMGHVGKNSTILKIDKLAPHFSYISFDGRTRTVEKLSKQNQKIFYSEAPVLKFYASLEDDDSGIDIENSVLYLKNERNEAITLNMTNRDKDNDNTSCLLELIPEATLSYGIYKFYILSRDNVGNLSSPSANITIVIGQEYLDSVMNSALPSFEISKALNYPNPCSSSGTNISFYSTVSPVNVNVLIYSIAGQLIRDIDLGMANSEADGFISTFWNLTDDFGQTVPNGVYIYKILATDNQTTKILKGKIGVLK